MLRLLRILRDFCTCYRKKVVVGGERGTGRTWRDTGTAEPQVTQRHSTKPTLVLDLDNTLVYSTFRMPKLYDFCVEIPRSRNILIYVKARPYAAEFISAAEALYEVVIFTSAKREYAKKVVDRIDTNKNISRILYRESCTFTNGRYVKDLRKVGRSLDRVILIDDNPYSYELQPRNGIHIPPYTGAEDDDSLLKILRFLEGLPKEDLLGGTWQAPFRNSPMTGFGTL
ncbi:carboxy-terminal domain RNA polymerase II polypeptide A small phosphatase 1 [Encephalitozoon cuniculi]|nr:carboxy-terminal domain RNA polymerase II polypeptide A small phosphatase 1 [Encephalitozoon cuniculi]